MNGDRVTKKDSLQTTPTKTQTILRNKFQWISAITNHFQGAVQQPISLREIMMRDSEIQRCLQHNIIFTIYCQICRKTLCASCMYSTSQHRKHRVIPIDNATDEMKQDMKAFEEKITKFTKQFEEIISTNEAYLAEVERKFSQFHQDIEQFYQNLKNLIKTKKTQQIAYIKTKKEEMKKEAYTFNKEMNKIQQFVKERHKSYFKFNVQNQLVLPSRCILESLLQVSNCIKQPPFKIEDLKLNFQPEKIKLALKDITLKINEFTTSFEKSEESKKVLLSKSVNEISRTTSLYSPKRHEEKLDAKKRLNASMFRSKHTKKA